MRLLTACLATASATASIALASESVFSIQDDLDAFPRYKLVPDPTPISPSAAEALLSLKWNETSATSPAELSPLHPAGPNGPPSTALEYILIRAPSPGISILPYFAAQQPGAHLCAIPRPQPPPHNATLEAEQRQQSKSESLRANRHGWQLLESMRGRCLYHIWGWWGYKFCYGGGVDKDGNVERGFVEQFHPLHAANGHVIWEPVVDRREVWFVLGREQVDSSSSPPSQPHPSSETEAQKPTTDSSFFFSDDEEGEEPKEGDLDLAASQSTPSNVPIRGTIHTGSSGRYLAQKYTSGTLCDLTKQPREIEIQYHCPTSSSVAGLTNPRIAHVKEVTTCNYQMLVYVPQLCEDRAFRKVKEGSALEIRCRRIVDSDDALEAEASVDEDEEVDDEEREKVRARQSATEELKEVLASAPVQRPIAIGGTIIGGNRYFAPNTEGKPFLAPPKKWVSSTHPPPEAGKLDAAAAAAISYSEEPTSGGPFVGTLPADSPLVELARNPKDPEDAEFIVIASAKIGINAFSILDEAGLKRLQLSREDVVNLVRDTKWHDLIQYEVNAGRRWFMIVVGELGGSGRDEDEKSGGEASSEIRAVVGDDETFLGSASSGGEGGKGSTVEQNRVDDLAEMMRKVQEVLFGGQEGDEERRRFRERWLEEVARATRMEIEKAAGSEEKDGDSGKSEGDEEARGTASSGDQTKGEAAEAAEPREKDAPGEGSKEEFFRDEL